MNKLFVLSVALLLSMTTTSLRAANWNNNQSSAVDTSLSIRLICETKDYSQSKYTLDWSKSWIPENYTVVVQDGMIVSSRGARGRVLRVTNERIEFIFDEYSDTRNDGGFIKGTYFRTNGRVNARVEFGGGYIPSGPIWGKCEEVPLSKVRNSDSSNANAVQSANTESSAKESAPLSKAKKECASIGYTPATEKYADCVMKLIN